MSFFKNLKKNEQKGQTIMEYIIITSLVGAVCLMAVSDFGTKVKTRVQHLKKQIVNQIPTS